jgi:hypothetical protein
MKPHSALAAYLQGVEAAFVGLQSGYVEVYLEELLTPERANLRIRVRFESGRLLEINEAVVVEHERLCHLDYRYHCQDEKNQLVFRYDSAPHFRDLSSFPHHKHLPGATIPTEQPSIPGVLMEAASAKTGL